MTAPQTRISRPMVGLCALVCLLAAVLLVFADDHIASAELWQASLMRVGLVLGAFWLALPSRGRDAAWAGISGTTFVALLLGTFVAARYRWAVIPVLIGVAVIGAFLRPRLKDRPRERAV